jgi:hypothetical protein
VSEHARPPLLVHDARPRRDVSLLVVLSDARATRRRAREKGDTVMVTWWKRWRVQRALRAADRERRHVIYVRQQRQRLEALSSLGSLSEQWRRQQTYARDGE